MSRLACIAVVTGLLLYSVSASAQRDVSCPTTLRPRFDNYQPIVFQGQEFETYWQNTAGGPMGGPSYAWFSATPNPDPISVDGTTRWRRARVLVHCFVTLSWGGSRTYHYHPIAYNGTLEPVGTACGGGDDPPDWGGGEYITTDPGGDEFPPEEAPLTRLRRDTTKAGVPPDTYITECPGGGAGGNQGGAGNITCHWEYMIIEISFDGGKTWYVWWEGWGQVCEENAS
ncbi:MAG TPA: hypothetical protein VF006_02600 [Longimicrobium sp.]